MEVGPPGPWPSDARAFEEGAATQHDRAQMPVFLVPLAKGWWERRAGIVISGWGSEKTLQWKQHLDVS